MPTSREPWVKVKIGARRSGKIAALPSDSARLGYVYTLLEAKVQRHMGVFDNRAHFVEVLGRFGRYLPDYIAQGLVHEVPDLCDECTRRNPGVRRGELVIHDFQREQRDPTNAERQADFRAARHDPEDDERNGERNAHITGNVTPQNAERNAPGNGLVTPTVTGDSRARRTTATATVTGTYEEEGSTRPSTKEDAGAVEGRVDPPSTEEAPWLERVR